MYSSSVSVFRWEIFGPSGTLALLMGKASHNTEFSRLNVNGAVVERLWS
jgi:hypothetical protein